MITPLDIENKTFNSELLTLDEYSTPEGYYYIEINTHLGSFHGDTMPDEIDSKYPSTFHASEIALAKALRKLRHPSRSKRLRDYLD